MPVFTSNVSECQNGIQWTFTKQLDDVDFAGNICLLSHTHKQMQKKLSKLMQETEKTDLKINIQKTKLLKVNSTQPAKVQLKGKYIEEDNKFTYLGSVEADKGGTDEDVKNRIGKARHAFSILEQCGTHHLSQIKKAANNRVHLKIVVSALCSTLGEED